jgi:hypothetical protein
VVKITVKTVIVIAGALVLLSATALFMSVLMAYHEANQARTFLQVLEAIRVGQTDRVMASHMTAKFNSHIADQQDATALAFVFANRWLSRLGLAPYTELRAYVRFSDAVAVEKAASIAVRDSGCAGSVREVKRGLGFTSGVAPPDFPNRIVGGSWNSPSNKRLTSIQTDETLGAADQRKSWNLNVSCLTKIGGCRDAREIIPIETTSLPHVRDMLLLRKAPQERNSRENRRSESRPQLQMMSLFRRDPAFPVSDCSRDADISSAIAIRTKHE